MKLSVIIVNYNVKYFLEQCLYSVQKASRNIETEIFIVDNNSTDGSRDHITVKFPAVNYIFNMVNDGFAKANNRAIALAKGEYILFLNPDTIVAEDSFQRCIDFLMNNPEAGALGVRMVDGSGNFLKESKRAFPTPLTSLYKLTGLADMFPRSRVFAKYYLGHLPDNEDREVDVIAGAFMMIPSRVLQITGSFDEIFFMYGEDIDLSYRIQRAGFRNYYFTGTTIIHFKGESTGKGKLVYVRFFYKAMSQFVKKHYSGTQAGIFVFFIQAGILSGSILSAIGRVFRRPASALPETGSVHNTLVGAGEKDYLYIKDMIQRSGRKLKIVGRVKKDATVAGEAMGNMEQLPGLIEKYQAKEIIFCGGELEFKEMISTIRQLPRGLNYKFHAEGSSSIVGSNNKDRNGDIITDSSIAPGFGK